MNFDITVWVGPEIQWIVSKDINNKTKRCFEVWAWSFYISSKYFTCAGTKKI